MEAEYKRANPEVQVVDGIPEHLVDRLGQTLHHGVAQNEHTDPEIYVPRRSFDEEAKRKLDLIYVGVSEILSTLKSSTRSNSSLNILNSDVRLLLDAASSMQEKSASQRGSTAEGGSGANDNGDDGTHEAPAAALVPHETPHNDVVCTEDEDAVLLLGGPDNSVLSSPFNLVTHQLTQVPRPIANLLELLPISHDEGLHFNEPDIISARVITSLEAIDLMNDFRSNYGRWVLFPQDVPTQELVERVRRKSPLLLTTCCCISLRYSLNGAPNPGDLDNHRRRRDTFQLVVRHLLRELTKAVLHYTAFHGCGGARGDVEFLQSVVLLLIYSMSLSSIVASAVDDDPLLDEERSLRLVNLDAWHLSGLGLTTFISRASMGRLLLESSAGGTPSFALLHDHLGSNEHDQLTALRIYNHLILVHLANCIFSGRMCVLDEIRLNYCKSALNIPSATNFDGRMVSEIGILLLAYNYVQENMGSPPARSLREIDDSHAAAVEEARSWHDQWEYLFVQPAVQFVECTYWFSCIVIDLVYNFAKVMAVYGMAGAKVESFRNLVATPDSISFIYGYCDRGSVVLIVARAHQLVRYVQAIDNDSYFAYLSDEIHFFFYFGCLVLIKGLGYLKSADKLHYLNDTVDSGNDGLTESSWRLALHDSQVLIDKFHRVGQDNPDDILTGYKNGLVECLEKLFPTWSQ